MVLWGHGTASEPQNVINFNLKTCPYLPKDNKQRKLRAAKATSLDLMSKYLLSIEFPFETMLSSCSGKDTSNAVHIECSCVLNSMHLAKPATVVAVHSFHSSIVDKRVSWIILDFVNHMLRELRLGPLRVPGTPCRQWSKIVGSDLDLKNIKPFISGGCNLHLCTAEIRRAIKHDWI